MFARPSRSLPARWAAAVLAAGSAAACGREAPRPPAPPNAPATPPAVAARPQVVDSILPIPELLRRFRADLGPDPQRLAGGAESREALVRRFARAVETLDTAAVRELVLSRREFAYLYYPETPLARPPYEAPPALLWFQISEGSNKGVTRLLRRLGGRPLGVVDHACAATPERQGPNRLWQRCTVRHVRAPGDTVRARMFGSVIERGGRYKFVSYANDL
jgi:hypothetical protein